MGPLGKLSGTESPPSLGGPGGLPLASLRIAIVNSIHSYGGGEKRVLRGAQDFAAAGHHVTVIGQPGGKLVERCRQEGVPNREVALKRSYAPGPILALAQVFREIRPDVIVCYEECSVRIGALAAKLARSREAPLAVVFYYGLEFSFKKKLYNRLLVVPNIDHIIANAEVLRQELVDFGWIPPDRISVIYDGVDPTPIDQADPTGVREELGVAPDELAVLVLARLVAMKGHAFLIDSLSKIAARQPRMKVWIAGEGPEEPRLREQIQRLGLDHCVRLLGFRGDAPRLLRAADILCHPSRREGAPNAVREAMVAALPVVAVAASGTPELVVEGKTGFLTPVGDEDALAAALDRVLSDADLRRRLGQAGRERALTEFSEARCARLWLERLSQCAEARRK